MTRKHTGKPFSVSQKKKQLQEKRNKKRDKVEDYDWGSYAKEPEPPLEQEKSFNKQNITSMVTDERSILRTIFEKEPRSVIDDRIKNSRDPLIRLSNVENDDHQQEDIQQQQLKDHIYTAIDMPLRPYWTYTMDRKELEQNEENYFDGYLLDIYGEHERESLNYFEHNLNVWRQLWRTLEISDILLLVADVRHPLFHFPQSLYKHITEQLNKPLILLLNKCDLVPQSFQELWVNWFELNYPKLKIVTFSSYAKVDEQDIKQRFKRKKKLVDKDLVLKIWQACQQVDNQAHQQYWEDLIEKREQAIIDQSLDPEEIRTREKLKRRHERKIKKNKTFSDDDEEEESSDEEKKQKKRNFVTVGLVGHPNTGKSCVLNGLVGRTVVSASYTPGHTKHFQTFFVSKYVRLCDSPGLVFPAVDMPRSLQVLCGLFPIAQAREPYSAVSYLAERVPIEKIYKLLVIPEGFSEWSAWSLCEAYAIKKKYFTPKKARPDVYRAANEILRDVLYGRVLLCFTPPGDQGLQSLITSKVKVLDKESVEQMKQDRGDRTETSQEETEQDETIEEDDHDDHDDGQRQQVTNPYAMLEDSTE
jgi:ribosome biogenesis GTPase A